MISYHYPELRMRNRWFRFAKLIKEVKEHTVTVRRE